MRHFPLTVLLFLLTACASGPDFNTMGVDPLLTPRGVTAKPQPATGKSVQWGGTIVSTANLQNSTQIEVLAYPLDSSGRPNTDGAAQGRFILERSRLPGTGQLRRGPAGHRGRDGVRHPHRAGR